VVVDDGDQEEEDEVTISLSRDPCISRARGDRESALMSAVARWEVIVLCCIAGMAVVSRIVGVERQLDVTPIAL
jgi:hypothetical protein